MGQLRLLQLVCCAQVPTVDILPCTHCWRYTCYGINLITCSARCHYCLQVLPTSNVASFFRQQQAVATHSHWQLLQIAPTATPGEFRIWALADSALYCVPLKVPRHVVIDSDRSKAQLQGQKSAAAALLTKLTGSKAVLPPGNTSRHTFEVCVVCWHIL